MLCKAHSFFSLVLSIIRRVIRKNEEWEEEWIWQKDGMMKKEGVVEWAKPITAALSRDLCSVELITKSERRKCWWERAGRKPCIIHLVPRSFHTHLLQRFLHLPQRSSPFLTFVSFISLPCIIFALHFWLSFFFIFVDANLFLKSLQPFPDTQACDPWDT